MAKLTDSLKKKDEQLFAEVERMQRGADGDYNRLYELSKNYVYKIIHDIVRDHFTTEDLMQETYLQIYNKINTLENPKAFYVWAGRIATNLTLRYIQKNRHEILAPADEEGSTDFVFERLDEDTESFIPESVLMDREKQRLIGEIIDGLSTEQKIAVQFFYFEEMSVKEIAAAMQCSEGTVKSRLNYARKSIKEAVLDMEVSQDTRLYSLSAMPVIFLVFRLTAEKLLLTGLTVAATGAATAAGVTTAGSAATAAGVTTAGGAATAEGAVVLTAGSGAASATGVSGVAAAGGSAAGASGAAAAGGTASGSAGSSAGGGLLAKIFGTTAGKVAVGVTTAAVVTTGAVVTMTQQEPKEIVFEDAIITVEYDLNQSNEVYSVMCGVSMELPEDIAQKTGQSSSALPDVRVHWSGGIGNDTAPDWFGRDFLPGENEAAAFFASHKNEAAWKPEGENVLGLYYLTMQDVNHMPYHEIIAADLPDTVVFASRGVEYTFHIDKKEIEAGCVEQYYGYYPVDGTVEYQVSGYATCDRNAFLTAWEQNDVWLHEGVYSIYLPADRLPEITDEIILALEEEIGSMIKDGTMEADTLGSIPGKPGWQYLYRGKRSLSAVNGRLSYDREAIINYNVHHKKIISIYDYSNYGSNEIVYSHTFEYSKGGSD